MEGESKMETPGSEKSVWSPDVLRRNFPHSSTPYWPMSLKKLNDSEVSLKHDSGYSSATPRSADSAGVLFGKCRLCNKSLDHSYTLGTPEYLCNCKNEGCMEAIKEVNMSPTPKISTRVRLDRPLELGLYEEDAMNSSLYHEEMEVDNFSSENHPCSLDILELGEEKSIDFFEPNFFTASLSSIKETTPTTLPPKPSSDHIDLKAGIITKTEKQENIDVKVNSETFFSPELFNNDLVNPKLKNEATPTKLKNINSPKRQKKGSFQTSVKKVATMNRVVRSFYSLNGIENLDFLYQLGVKKNIPHIISKIFEFLPERDLDTVRVVSKTWNKLLNNDLAAISRWKMYTNTMRLMKENMSSPVKQGGSGSRRPVLTRLQNIPNQWSPPRQPFSPTQAEYSPPVSPGSKRFQSYRKAAKSLKQNERLLPCPKCRFPSTDRGSPVAQCPRSGCRHRFCVWCNIEVIPDINHNCPPLYTPRCISRRNTVHSVGSKSSKRNLRRL